MKEKTSTIRDNEQNLNQEIESENIRCKEIELKIQKIQDEMKQVLNFKIYILC